jgi:methyl-accepting chemotaxis protein
MLENVPLYFIIFTAMPLNLNQSTHRWRLGRSIAVGLGAIVAVNLVATLVFRASLAHLEETAYWVNHTNRVKTELESLEKRLLQAETSQRGFIYTNDTSFLRTYERAVEAVPQDIADLRELLQTTPQQFDRLNEIESLVERKLDELAQTIELKQANREQELKALALSGLGQTIMQDFRTQIDEMMAFEMELLEHRRRASENAKQWANLTIYGSAIAIVLVAVAIYLFVRRRVVLPIQETAISIEASSTQIASTVQEQERIASEQAAAVNQTTTSVDELGSSSQQAAQQVEDTSNYAKRVLDLASAGNESVEQTRTGISTLQENVSRVAHQIMELNAQATEIGSISRWVGDLANQTNMLALNAAVEAVRAGERGKGFGVVAGEIRKLADRSNTSSQKINALVGDIQTAISTAIQMAEQGTDAVKNSVKITERTADTFARVTDSVNSVADNSQQVSINIRQQNLAIQQIVTAMNSLNQGASETASGIAQTRTSTRQLSETAKFLRDLV